MNAVRFSSQVFRSLLVLYPRGYRDEYQGDMAQAFLDYCREVEHKSGVVGLIGVWIPTLVDVLVMAVKEHINNREVMEMTDEKLYKRTGFLLLITGLLWVFGAAGAFETLYIDNFGGSDMWYELASYGLWGAFITSLIALVHLYLYVHRSTSTLGKRGLQIAVAGNALSLIGWVVMLFVPVALEEVLWAGSFGLIVLSWVGVTVFGVAHFKHPLNASFKALPFVAGVIPMLMMVLSIWLSEGAYFPEASRWIQFGSYVVVGLAWAFWGYTFFQPEPLREVAA